MSSAATIQVVVEGKKYACETCIKGHRSSACKHTDRPLFEIKRKGRPVTQCEHCRALRKTKQVHVKCVCETKDDDSGDALSTKKGGKKVQATAAFPSGLPPELEAAVASQLMSEGSSDSDHGGSCDTCDCKAGGQCHCATPRGGGRGKKNASAREASTSSAVSVPAPVAGSMFRIPEGANPPHLRPVLPRPSPGVSPDPSAPPSQPGHPSHLPRHQVHGSTYYSPYGRAYEQVHIPDRAAQSMPRPMGVPNLAPNQNILSPELYQFFANAPSVRDIPMMPGQGVPPQISWPSPNDESFPLCNCGDNCSCPGCLEHRGPNAAGYSSFQTCTNPNSCSSCLSCSILSLPYEASTTGFSDPQSYQLADELLARLPDVVGRVSSESSLNPLSMGQQMPPSMMQGYSGGQQAWQNYFGGGAQSPSGCGIPNPGEPRTECCSGQCKCPPGRCSCPPDCCGCCQGCQCGHDEDPSRGGLTFAVSGERGACCSHNRSRQAQGNIPGASQFPSSFGAANRTASSSASHSSRSASYQNAYSPTSPGASSSTASGSCCSTRNIPRS